MWLTKFIKNVLFFFKFILGATPVITWFAERSQYTTANPEKALHFTQVVWKNTRLFGLGVCNTTDDGIIFVANYYPRGNYKDQFVKNVLCKSTA